MNYKQSKTERSGFVVVVVLCMVILMSVLLLGFNRGALDCLRTADDTGKTAQTLNCARAGLNIAIAAVRDTPDIYANKALANLLSGKGALDIGGGNCSVTVTEENGKLNLNLLKNKDGTLNQTRIDQLLRLIDLLNQEQAGHPRVGYDLVPAVIDWTDSDDQVTCLPFIKNQNLGAESGYYGMLTPPYKCKNAPLDTTEELLLVKGVTPDVFALIHDYVTVYGDGEININCAPKHIIESLSEKMDPALAQLIIDRRKIKPFETITELQDVSGMTDSIYYAIKKAATVGSTARYYQVVSRGNAGQLGSTIVALLRRDTEIKTIEVVSYKEI
ncbi:MAG: general secretion pathway protein GspK [Sedimentisphaerales bacterium]|nr:general secretion pathway protein GspK [Sedimentisphaerales bacterium]